MWIIVVSIIIVIIIISFLISYQVVEYYRIKSMDHNTLDRLSNKLLELCRNIDKFEGEDRERLQHVCDKLKNTKLYQDETGSYALGKRDIYLCLNDNNGELYDDNTLMYVLLHELAHVINETIGHDEAFEENFAFLRNCSTKVGIYNPYKSIDMKYCKKD